MKNQTKLFSGAVAVALAASTVLAASGASASPRDDDRYDGRGRRENVERHYRNDQFRDRRFDARFDNRNAQFRDRRFDARFDNRNAQFRDWRFDNHYDRDDGRYVRRDIYAPRERFYPGARFARLPDGCRRVVYRDRVYYTRDNVYYSYDPFTQGYVVVNLNLLGLNIGF